jgi:ABC-type sulfate/molybdate transport systems ATPase subunit
MSGGAPILEVKGLHTSSLKNINLTVSSSGIVAVAGPDIHGKTELINAIAGLTKYEGTILLEGVSLEDLQTREGKIGYTFHKPMPDANVLTNVALNLKPLGLPENEVMEKAGEALKALGIEELGGKTPKELSIFDLKLFELACITAPSPRVILLKEPFEGLSLEEKHLLGEALRTLKQKHPILLTSRLMSDVDTLADRILLLNEGEVIQSGHPSELLFEPANKAVSNITCGGNVFTVITTTIIASGLALVNCGKNLIFTVPYEKGRIEKVAVYPEGVKVFKHKPKNLTFNSFKASVQAVNEKNGDVDLQLGLVGGGDLTARLSKAIAKASKISKEDQVYAWIDPAYIRTLIRL